MSYTSAMNSAVTRESIMERVRSLPDSVLEAADLLLAELTPLSDEDWMQVLESAPVDDEPLSLKEVRSLDEEHERRSLRRASEDGQRKAM